MTTATHTSLILWNHATCAKRVQASCSIKIFFRTIRASFFYVFKTFFIGRVITLSTIPSYWISFTIPFSTKTTTLPTGHIRTPKIGLYINSFRNIIVSILTLS